MNLPIPIGTTAHRLIVATITQQPSQTSLTGQINQVSNTLGGLSVLFLFMSYICVGVGYKKYNEKRAVARKEQIQRLERLWKITPQ